MATTLGAFVAGGIAACGGEFVVFLVLGSEKWLHSLNALSVPKIADCLRDCYANFSSGNMYSVIISSLYFSSCARRQGIATAQLPTPQKSVLIAYSPFETVKIRMQLQGELQEKGAQPRMYKGPFHGVSVIVRNEGLNGIYRGIGAAYVYQMILNGCRLGFYEPLRQSLTSAIFTDAKTQSLGINIFAGAASGILGAAAGSPFFLVKTRLQSFSPFAPVGTQHKYKNAIDGMRQIYRSEGTTGLYRGVGAAMVRTGFGSSVQLPTYFFAKRRLVKHLGMEEGPALHLASSTASGFVVCCVMHPPDTIMSRMYNQDGNLYKGIFDCFAKTIKTEGVLAIYKGFLPHLARILPHTILTLSLAEQTNKLMRKFENKILPSAATDSL